MATIRAAWKRTVRVKEYESETLEIALEENALDAPYGDPEVGVAALSRALAKIVDELVAERLASRAEAVPAPHETNSTQFQAPRPTSAALAPVGAVSARVVPPMGASTSAPPPEGPDVDPLI